MVMFTASDVIVSFLGGTITGSTAYMWGLEIPSGSVDSQIQHAEWFVQDMVGDALYNNYSTDWTTQSTGTTQNALKGAVMDYACFRIAVQVSRGVITDGFDYRVGPLAASRSKAFTVFFKDICDTFRDQAFFKISKLMPLSYSEDTVMDTSETPDWAGEAAGGMY